MAYQVRITLGILKLPAPSEVKTLSSQGGWGLYVDLDPSTLSPLPPFPTIHQNSHCPLRVVCLGAPCSSLYKVDTRCNARERGLSLLTRSLWCLAPFGSLNTNERLFFHFRFLHLWLGHRWRPLDRPWRYCWYFVHLLTASLARSCVSAWLIYLLPQRNRSAIAHRFCEIHLAKLDKSIFLLPKSRFLQVAIEVDILQSSSPTPMLSLRGWISPSSGTFEYRHVHLFRGLN